MRSLRLSHRGRFLPDQVFQRSLVHQLSPQREVRIRRAGYQPAVRATENGRGAVPDFQREGTEVGAGGGWILREGRGRAAGVAADYFFREINPNTLLANSSENPKRAFARE